MAAAAKPYDLEERTFGFAADVRRFAGKVRRSLANAEDLKQLVRASGSVGANYIEANEAVSKKDFALRIRIARKEAKESHYWLRLLDIGEDEKLERERAGLVDEAMQLRKILSAIAATCPRCGAL